jgi:sec-independent protein translocase protein TatB
MLGIGSGEMMIIAVIALLVIGPEGLPNAMRQAGRWYGQLRRAADDLRRAFVLEADRQDAADRYRQLQERRKAAQETRRKAEAEAGGEGASQPEVATPSAPPHPLMETGRFEPGSEPATEIEPNDVPPDAPHPDAMRRAAGQGERR